MAAKTKTADSPETPALVTVRVGNQAIFEGEHLPAGSVFETTPERAEALGALVETVTE